MGDAAYGEAHPGPMLMPTRARGVMFGDEKALQVRQVSDEEGVMCMCPRPHSKSKLELLVLRHPRNKVWWKKRLPCDTH